MNKKQTPTFEEDSDDPRIPVAEEDLDDLIAPETFLSLAKKASSLSGTNRNPNYWLVETGAFMLGLGTSVFSNASTAEIAKVVRDASDKTFGFVGAVLGFIIAAFAILATVTQARSIVALAGRDGGEKFIEVKRIGLLFISAFVPYIAFAGWYAVLLALGWQGGPATMLAVAFPTLGRLAACLFLGGIAFALARMLVALGALVTNVYTTFMFLANGSISMSTDVRVIPKKQQKTQDTTTSADASLILAPITRIEESAIRSRGRDVERGSDGPELESASEDDGEHHRRGAH